MTVVFGDFDTSDFWENDEYAVREYIDEWPSDLIVTRIQEQLGYTLPRSYVELARAQNGGTPRKTCHSTQQRTSWARDHVAITGIYSIGDRRPCSLCGEAGNELWLMEWGYPPIGVYFADCPSAGHDMICLDYRANGRHGEPQVVHVDQECDYRITFVAASFEAFIRGLQHEDAFPTP